MAGLVLHVETLSRCGCLSSLGRFGFTLRRSSLVGVGLSHCPGCLLRFLLQRGASLSAVNCDGDVPLDIALDETTESLLQDYTLKQGDVFPFSVSDTHTPHTAF